MNFHLNFTPETSSFKINHSQSILLVGSCFSENIGKHLQDAQFKVSVNPNGILFNPLSISTFLKSTIENKKTEKHSTLQRDNLFYSYNHHTSFYASTESYLLRKLDAITDSTHHTLKSADVLVITFGTAFYYHHKELAQTVANCHKQSASTFDKKLMEVEEMVSIYTSLIQELENFNPKLKVIFTVSPVKYLKDGIIENNLSKSTLLLGINKLIKLFPEHLYFPSFELVNDDLRDYRFYKEDLAHPNQQAIEYVWQKFSDCYFEAKTSEINLEIQKLNSALNHRQMNENSAENGKLAAFIEKQKNIIKKLDSGIEF